MSSKTLAAFLAAFLVLSGGAAANETDGRLYLSGGGGLMRLNSYCNPNPLLVQYKCEDSEEAYQAFVGYSVSEYFALETGWSYSEGYNASGRYADDPSLSDTLRNSPWQFGMRNQSAHLGFRTSVKLTEWLGITGMAGAYFWRRAFDFKGNAPGAGAAAISDADQSRRESIFSATNKDEKGVDFVGGAGVEFFFAPKFSSQWRWTHYAADERYKGDLYSINFNYQF